ncbi:hypothetical protein [Chlamydiifrater phoenicopteri]|uniref:hypothetical protein n=1 Tax=Chlamydiifrater phoenicopteri TaxID=2681469 RepID=UPI001BCEDAFB|nr:hypothetical protein [Chlamydiifrater phoenicopteri]
MSKGTLTNEKLNKKFDSPFVLVNCAIKQAKIRIQRGDVRTSNAAIEILELLSRDDFVLGSEDSIENRSGESCGRMTSSGSSYRKKDPSAYTWSDVK